MGDAFIWFQPSFPEHWKFPPDYSVEGICDEAGTFFHWSRVDATGDYVAFGPNCKTKSEARRGAWADYRGPA